MTSNLLEALSTICEITPPVQEAFQKIAKRRSLPKGAILLEEGELSDEVFFVEKGLVRAFYNENAREVTAWLVNEGHFLCSLPSYLLRRPSRETIQLLEPATLVVLAREDLIRFKGNASGAG